MSQTRLRHRAEREAGRLCYEIGLASGIIV